MKKTIVLMTGLIFLFSMPIVANAISIVDDTTKFGWNYARDSVSGENDFISKGWGSVNKLNGTGDHVAWKHQYVFIPPMASITSASLTLHFQDDFGWFFTDIFDLFGQYEYADLWTEDGTLHHLGEIDPGHYNPLSIDGAFLGDGEFKVTLTSTGGDFYIRHSDLQIKYNAAVPTPEPATMLSLMAAGFVGIIGCRKKNKGQEV